MKSVKVLSKGQITLPRDIRKKMEIKTGDMLLLEEKDRQVVIKKGKTIFDYIGAEGGCATFEDEPRPIDRMTQRIVFYHWRKKRPAI